MSKDTSNLNSEVENWWNNNPFSYGVGSKKGDQVGAIDLDDMDLGYFNELDRRFRKHTKDGAQEDGKPLFSNYINYEELKGKKVLDIAVGSGFSMTEFIRQGAGEVVGIDLTQFAIDQTKKHLAFRNMKGEVLKMDAQNMSFEDNTFDFVCAWGCYMHMPDTEGAIRETYRVLRENGKALAYMYNRDSWPFWFNTILIKGILLGDLIRYRGNVTKLTSRYADGCSDGGNPLTKFYSKKAVKKMYEDAGFTNVKVVPFLLPGEPNAWPFVKIPVFKYILPRSIKKYIARWGYGLIVQAEK